MSNASSGAVTPEAWEQALAAEFPAFLEETRAAMNAAREGPWIVDPEEDVLCAVKGRLADFVDMLGTPRVRRKLALARP
jgi:hypothetical protein